MHSGTVGRAWLADSGIHSSVQPNRRLGPLQPGWASLSPAVFEESRGRGGGGKGDVLSPLHSAVCEGLGRKHLPSFAAAAPRLTRSLRSQGFGFVLYNFSMKPREGLTLGVFGLGKKFKMDVRPCCCCKGRVLEINISK